MTNEERQELMRRATLGGATLKELCELGDALERDRVIGVLDAWDEAHPNREAFSAFKSAGALVPSHAYVCASGYNTTLELAYYGSTRDAARAAAAKAIEAGEVSP